jgi:integrase
MAGGLRATELTHLRWRDLDLAKGELAVARSKTAAGLRRVSLEPELVQLLREHKIASAWSQPDDFVFPGRDREKPRDRNSVRKRVLYGAIDHANERLASEGKPPLPEGITFHSLRRTYAALRAELGEHPAITAAQMGHRDPRMTLRVYTDVTGIMPQTRMAGLLGDADWAPLGTGGPNDPDAAPLDQHPEDGGNRQLAAASPSGSDGTRTRGLRRDRPAL